MLFKANKIEKNKKKEKPHHMEQKAFEEEEIIEDDVIPEIIAASEPHMALLFLLDTSGSMKQNGAIGQLNAGLNRFKMEVCENKQTKEILDVAIVEFNTKHAVIQEFVPVEYIKPVELTARGGTVMSPAIDTALEMVTERSKFYRRAGTEPYKPWVMLVSDGAPSDNIDDAAKKIKDMEDAGKLSFRSLGVGDFDSKVLHKLSGQKVMKLTDGTDFTDFFDWVNKSMRSVSQSSPGERPKAEKLSGNVVVDTDWD